MASGVSGLYIGLAFFSCSMFLKNCYMIRNMESLGQSEETKSSSSTGIELTTITSESDVE